jgi:murein DD-endopeptidase MepM/ murein hydrolase activator NlpD
VLIRHDDGLISEYIHLKQNSAWVKAGDIVFAGDTIAQTGDTGDVGTWEHLHFDINYCGDNWACDTQPVTFRNTSPNPEGLKFDQHYTAF